MSKQIKSIKRIDSPLITYNDLSGTTVTAKVDLESEDLPELIKALTQLLTEGFVIMWCTYDLGYYDSVDNKRLELMRDIKGLKIEYI